MREGEGGGDGVFRGRGERKRTHTTSSARVCVRMKIPPVSCPWVVSEMKSPKKKEKKRGGGGGCWAKCARLHSISFPLAREGKGMGHASSLSHAHSPLGAELLVREVLLAHLSPHLCFCFLSRFPCVFFSFFLMHFHNATPSFRLSFNSTTQPLFILPPTIFVEPPLRTHTHSAAKSRRRETHNKRACNRVCATPTEEKKRRREQREMKADLFSPRWRGEHESTSTSCNTHHPALAPAPANPTKVSQTFFFSALLRCCYL